MVIEARLHGTAEVFRPAVSGDGDEESVLAAFIPAKLLGDLIAVHAGKSDVEEHRLGLVGPGDLEAPLPSWAT